MLDLIGRRPAWRACALPLLASFVTGSCNATVEPVEQPTPMPGPSPFVYPIQLWDRKLQGETMLMVHVSEVGVVDSAYVLDSSGHMEFDSSAIRGASLLRFAPGKQGQRRVAMWTKLPVRFSIDTLQAVGLPVPGNGSHD